MAQESEHVAMHPDHLPQGDDTSSQKRGHVELDADEANGEAQAGSESSEFDEDFVILSEDITEAYIDVILRYVAYGKWSSFSRFLSITFVSWCIIFPLILKMF